MLLVRCLEPIAGRASPRMREYPYESELEILAIDLCHFEITTPDIKEM